MPTPAGTISFSQIESEFGRNGSKSLGSYRISQSAGLYSNLPLDVGIQTSVAVGNNGGTGQTGASGNATGGQSGYSGGFAGCYITFNGNVTWVNTGDRRGQVC